MPLNRRLQKEFFVFYLQIWDTSWQTNLKRTSPGNEVFFMYSRVLRKSSVFFSVALGDYFWNIATHFGALNKLSFSLDVLLIAVTPFTKHKCVSLYISSAKVSAAECAWKRQMAVWAHLTQQICRTNKKKSGKLLNGSLAMLAYLSCSFSVPK